MATESTPWHEAYPAPKSVPPTISRAEVLGWLQEGRKDIVLVDVRRTDREVSGWIMYLSDSG